MSGWARIFIKGIYIPTTDICCAYFLHTFLSLGFGNALTNISFLLLLKLSHWSPLRLISFQKSCSDPLFSLCLNVLVCITSKLAEVLKNTPALKFDLTLLAASSHKQNSSPINTVAGVSWILPWLPPICEMRMRDCRRFSVLLVPHHYPGLHSVTLPRHSLQ
ncbi:hypothetical protein BGX38DRAFT_120337 [Terfezia claveryi]|nr:hypothetical protein BGX38DRAFT_120337 [Terfezia claveryi]